jgi:hypothetical protein
MILVSLEHYSSFSFAYKIVKLLHVLLNSHWKGGEKSHNLISKQYPWSGYALNEVK